MNDPLFIWSGKRGQSELVSAEMNARGLENAIEGLARPIVEEMGLSVIDVRLAKEGPNRVLRIVIYRPEGVGLDDCERVSQRLSPALDEADLFATSYNLEVSSPGLERVFRRREEYEVFKGHRVYVTTYAPVEGVGREVRGILGGVVHADADGGRGDDAGGAPAVRISLEKGGEVLIPLDDIARARLDEAGFPSAGEKGGRRRER